MNSLKSAIWYAENKNFSIIPVNKDKKPLIRWTEYQKKRADVAQIKKWWTKWPEAMVGIVTGKISGISVIDVDTEHGFNEIDKLIPDSMIMPTVKTPKGGQHMYFKDCGLPNNARVIDGCDFRGEGGYIIAPPSKNGNGKNYEWLKDLKISDVELPNIPDAYLRALASSIYNNNIYTNTNSIEGCSHNKQTMFSEGRRDNDLFHTAHLLNKGGMPSNEIVQVLNNLIISCYGKPDLDMAKEKLESAVKRQKRLDGAISDHVKDFIMTTTGYFMTTDVYQGLQLTTRKEKKNVTVALMRFRDKGIIEKHGKKNGTWRLINNECEEIDFLNAPTDEIDIKWPFDIQDWVKTLPKNIIVVAGEGNSGKTAFLLNLVEMNMYNHDIQYFSSEMGAVEMKERLSKFDRPLDSWKFTPKERMSDFGDVIKPDAINIIDFLEVYDDFYRIGAMIREMYDSLNNGIAVIAIQKNKGADYGLGGSRSLEKARLYLNIEPGKVTIVKGKNWRRGDINPNGMSKEFKLVQGCKFIDDGYWIQKTD